MVSSGRSILFLFFDTAKQHFLNVAVLMSMHFLSRIGIETGDNVTAGFGRGSAFPTGFPVRTSSMLSTGISSDVSVTYLLTPFTTRTQETVLSRNKDSIMISILQRP